METNYMTNSEASAALVKCLLAEGRLVIAKGKVKPANRLLSQKLATLPPSDAALVSTYSSFRSMLRRCTNPNDKNFARYGARGAHVDPSLSTFEGFISYLGVKKSADMTLERVDNCLWYTPGNVKWATRLEQSRNRSVSVRVVIDEREVALADAADTFGLSISTLSHRIRSGWGSDRLLRPPGKGGWKSRGTENHKSALTEKQVRWLRSVTKPNFTHLGAQLGVSPSTIAKAYRGQTYKDLL